MGSEWGSHVMEASYSKGLEWIPMMIYLPVIEFTHINFLTLPLVLELSSIIENIVILTLE